MDKDTNKLADRIKKILADFLGVDADDIKNEYSLADELHMTASDLTDFVEALRASGIDTSSLVLTEIDSFDDLIENLSNH